MEIVKYLCEFFFTNFWHFLGLLCVVVAIFGDKPLIKIGGSNKTENKNK